MDKRIGSNPQKSPSSFNLSHSTPSSKVSTPGGRTAKVPDSPNKPPSIRSMGTQMSTQKTIEEWKSQNEELMESLQNVFPPNHGLEKNVKKAMTYLMEEGDELNAQKCETIIQTIQDVVKCKDQMIGTLSQALEISNELFQKLPKDQPDAEDSRKFDQLQQLVNEIGTKMLEGKIVTTEDIVLLKEALGEIQNAYIAIKSEQTNLFSQDDIGLQKLKAAQKSLSVLKSAVGAMKDKDIKEASSTLEKLGEELKNKEPKWNNAFKKKVLKTLLMSLIGIVVIGVSLVILMYCPPLFILTIIGGVGIAIGQGLIAKGVVSILWDLIKRPQFKTFDATLTDLEQYIHIAREEGGYPSAEFGIAWPEENPFVAKE